MVFVTVVFVLKCLERKWQRMFSDETIRYLEFLSLLHRRFVTCLLNLHPRITYHSLTHNTIIWISQISNYMCFDWLNSILPVYTTVINIIKSMTTRPRYQDRGMCWLKIKYLWRQSNRQTRLSLSCNSHINVLENVLSLL